MEYCTEAFCRFQLDRLPADGVPTLGRAISRLLHLYNMTELQD